MFDSNLGTSCNYCLQSLKVPRANIIIGAEIGRGGFGIVL